MSTKAQPPEALTDEESANESVLIAEERLGLETRNTVTGRVRVQTLTDSIYERVSQALSRVDVDIARVPIGTVVQPGTAAPQPRTEGNVTIIPILEETLVVEKRLVVKEELRITRRETTEIVEMPVALRKQRALIQRLDSEGATIAEPQEETS